MSLARRPLCNEHPAGPVSTQPPRNPSIAKIASVKVLLIEDDDMLREITADGLRSHGFDVSCAADGSSGLDECVSQVFDVVVVDRDLPGVHGDDVCRTLTQAADAPRVLMLTAFGSLRDRIEGFEHGADDYLPKPFDLSELAARIAALARRPTRLLREVTAIGDVAVDRRTLVAQRAGRELSLTPKEFGVLSELMADAPTVVSAERLLEVVWGDVDPFTQAVKVTVANLRAKLGEPSPIVTRIGQGYCFVAP